MMSEEQRKIMVERVWKKMFEKKQQDVKVSDKVIKTFADYALISKEDGIVVESK